MSRLCLITGATGFVGTALCGQLLQAGFRVRCAGRSAPTAVPGAERMDYVQVGEFHGSTNWSEALQGVDAVVHLAARVHVMRDTATDPAAEFHKVNVEGTRGLAEAAAHAGVRRFLFASSIKVNGEHTGTPFTEDSVPAPEDQYSLSKWHAEQLLQQLAQRGTMQVAILRFPLLYGPGVKGNFRQLVSLVDRGVPLPLGLVRNRRSLMYVANLAHLLAHCVSHPAATGTFLVSDGEDLSTPDLIRRLARALMRRPRLVPVPPLVLRLAGKLLGKSDVVKRLVGSLAVDSGRIRRVVEWSPPYTVDQGLESTSAWYLSQAKTT